MWCHCNMYLNPDNAKMQFVLNAHRGMQAHKWVYLINVQVQMRTFSKYHWFPPMYITDTKLMTYISTNPR